MLVVRRRADLFLVVCTLIAWSVIATGVGVAQFVGANIFVSGATGGRQLSFLGFHDFGALSAAALACAAVGIALPRFGLPAGGSWTAAGSGALRTTPSLSLPT